jgi:hypothetical protein
MFALAVNEMKEPCAGATENPRRFPVADEILFGKPDCGAGPGQTTVGNECI